MLVGSGSLGLNLKLFNPLYAIAPIILFSITIPLAVFAIFTTIIAIIFLGCRAAVVAVELSVALAGAYINPPPSKALLARTSPSSPLSERTSPPRHRRQRSHAGSTSSLDTVVPTPSRVRLPNNNASLTNLIGASGITRDFEGVGGWRTPGDDDEEALWMGMNSRLQLPADATPRRHQRSLTGGTSPGHRWSWSPEAPRRSPAQSRVRTPVSFTAVDGDDYFPSQQLTNVRPSSSATDLGKRHHRRKSSSSSSRASIIAMTTKEEGE